MTDSFDLNFSLDCASNETVVNNGEGGNTLLKPHTQVPHLSLNPDEAKKREAVKVDFGEDEESDGSFSTPPETSEPKTSSQPTPRLPSQIAAVDTGSNPAILDLYASSNPSDLPQVDGLSDGPQLPLALDAMSAASANRGNEGSFGVPNSISSSDEPQALDELRSVQPESEGSSYGVPNSVLSSAVIQQTADLSSQENSAPAPRQRGRTGRGNIDEFKDFHKDLKLRPYQEDVAEKSLRGENDIILLPTGTGKTYVAIKVIIEHLDSHRLEKPKVVFFVPTAVLAQQQFEKIKEHMAFAWYEKVTKITGDDNIPAEQVKDIIKGDDFAVLIVTPAIIGNYFAMCKDASLSDFTLLIFDEYHHAKKDHPYNDLIRRCLESSKESKLELQLPQMMGMTATIGIGTSGTLHDARSFILEMCAKFRMKSAPSEPPNSALLSSNPLDLKIRVEHRRDDDMSQFLQNYVMERMEMGITKRFASKKFKDLNIDSVIQFPKDRVSQVYEQYVVNLQTQIAEYHSIVAIREDVTYCMVALLYLNTFYKALQLNSLLYCEHGMRYIETELDMKPVYKSIPAIWHIYTDNLDGLKARQRSEDEDRAKMNDKIQKLRAQLDEVFADRPDSKVIIFVQMRVVAQYMADLLNKLRPGVFKAKEFTSEGPSSEDAGMKPQDRLDAREGFENDKYNILVSTSVLEEGIDIQACNVVVRYMYIKDMIAKIQSKGRARQADALLVTFLDDKLLRQENKNNYRENLMLAALQEIKEMSKEEFDQKIQERLHILMSPKKKPIKPAGPVPKKAEVKCKICGKPLGYMSQVRKYGQSHFLIMDGTLHEKVKAYPDPGFMKPMDGMVPYGRLVCKGDAVDEKEICGNKVGTLMKMDSGYHFGMWYIKGITVNNVPLKKYKQVTDVHRVEIHEIQIEEIIKLGEECQFPPELLQERPLEALA